MANSATKSGTKQAASGTNPPTKSEAIMSINPSVKMANPSVILREHVDGIGEVTCQAVSTESGLAGVTVLRIGFLKQTFRIEHHIAVADKDGETSESPISGLLLAAGLAPDNVGAVHRELLSLMYKFLSRANTATLLKARQAEASMIPLWEPLQCKGIEGQEHCLYQSGSGAVLLTTEISCDLGTLVSLQAVRKFDSMQEFRTWEETHNSLWVCSDCVGSVMDVERFKSRCFFTE